MKRSELKRKTPLKAKVGLKRTGALRPRSEKSKAKDSELKRSVTLVKKRSRGQCEAIISLSCRRKGQHIHHRKLRSQGGTHHPSNLLHVCFACHIYIHNHPEDSYAMGLLVHRDDDPAEVQVR